MANRIINQLHPMPPRSRTVPLLSMDARLLILRQDTLANDEFPPPLQHNPIAEELFAAALTLESFNDQGAVKMG